MSTITIYRIEGLKSGKVLGYFTTYAAAAESIRISYANVPEDRREACISSLTIVEILVNTEADHL
jgi:hypothetical protein